jgi:hypothetical protein
MRRSGLIFPVLLSFLVSLSFLTAPAIAAQSCGTPDDVLARYAAALGGEAALSRLQTLAIEASATEPHTFNPSSTAHYHYGFEWKTPGKIRVKQHYALSFATYIYDGAAWSLANGRVSHNEDATPEWRRQLMRIPYNDDPQFLMFRVAANPLLIATTKNLYRRYELLPGEPGICKLEAFGRSEWGPRRDALTFDSESGLLVKWAIEAGEPRDHAHFQFEFDDYQQAGEVKIPRSIYFDFYETQFRITSVAVNAPIRDADFVVRQ